MAKAKTSSIPGTESILHTKLMPPRLRLSVISRQDLLERLDSGLEKKLTVIAAPTGFGKTTLASMWIASRDFKSAWVNLDEYDNDPSRFWMYFVSALRNLDATVGKDTLSALNAPQNPAFHTLITPLINDLAKASGPYVLVLEDFHFISSKDIRDGLAFLIQNLPDALHLVLIARTSPDLSLHLLRARDELLEINIADLRFDFEETKSFLRVSNRGGMPLSAVESLFQKTEGWPAGLQLAILYMQNKDPEQLQEFIQSFSGSQRYISEYLIKEVFENQTEQIRNFLLKTCFLQSLTASLCDVTAEIHNSATLLEFLERDHLFLVRLDPRGGQPWYRYNPLFAESIQFLARQQMDETAILSLYERASRWYEYQGRLEESITSALDAGLFERALFLIEKYVEIHDLRELRTLSRWLEVIPAPNILGHPILCFTFAQIILYSGDRFASATAVRIEPYLGAAEMSWRTQQNLSCLGQLHSFRGNVAWWQSDLPKAFEFARQSLEELPETEIFWRGNSLLILGYAALNEGRVLDTQDLILEARALLGAAQNIYGVLASLQLLSEVFYLKGDLDQSEQLNRQILTEAVGDESMLDDRGYAFLSLANIAYERNELDASEKSARRAFALAQQRANALLQVQATIRLAKISLAKGDLPDAQELIGSMEARIQNPSLLPELQNARAIVSMQANQGSYLERWVIMISEENRNILPLQKELETFTLARFHIKEGRPKEALSLLANWKTDATENGRLRSHVQFLLLEALACQADSKIEKAILLLIEALDLGQSKGFRRLFLDEGPRMAVLLQAAIPSLPNRTLSLFAGTLLHLFPAGAAAHLTASGTTIQIEALSQQELRVLRLLVAGLSNAEIANELVVSGNTVKTHVKSIYRKLSVRSREEAREVARGLKLV